MQWWDPFCEPPAADRDGDPRSKDPRIIFGEANAAAAGGATRTEIPQTLQDEGRGDCFHRPGITALRFFDGGRSEATRRGRSG